MNIITIPYRDQYFCQKYGFIVRDLMIIKTLEEAEEVKRIVVVNRPVSVYEKLLDKSSRRKNLFTSKTKIWNQLSFDMLGPLKKRAWTETCFQKYLSSIVEYAGFPDEEKNVLLDFTPIAKIDYSIFNNYIIWYDLIDNFSKHNAYSQHEKDLVQEKYNIVNKCANLVTGVTQEAISGFDNIYKYTVANGILERNSTNLNVNGKFDFGFLGFITDKLDLAFIQQLAEQTNYSIAVYGEVYDHSIARELQSIQNVTLFGRFSSYDIEKIMDSFTIGLIPYLMEKSHDGSPLKLYQYLDFGKPVIMSQPFDMYTKSSDYVHIYRKKNFSEVVDFVNKIEKLKKNDIETYVSAVRQEVSDKVLWKNKIANILKILKGIPG